MSRLLAHHDVDFYWNMRKDQTEWHHRLSVNKIMNRFCRSLYTSKEGLALLLQQMYWHTEPGVASVNFPRCYVLGICFIAPFECGYKKKSNENPTIFDLQVFQITTTISWRISD